MQHTSSLRRQARSLLTALLLLFCAADAFADSYSSTSPPTLTIPSMVVGGATFSPVVISGLTVADIIPPAPVFGGAPNGSEDTYNIASQTLFIPSVSVNGNSTPYANVSVTLANVAPSQVTFGSVTGADTFGGGTLNITAVQITSGPLAGKTFCSVAIPVADINLNSLTVSMGMPRGTEDVYDWTSSLLTIPAVTVAASGKVYTNVTVTLSGVSHITGASCNGSGVLAAANGTISGAWVRGVTITMSGAASGTTTTDVNGNYSFANLPSGHSYTFTPTLSGYSYASNSETVAIPTGSSTAVPVPAMTASSVYPSYSISGTVSYSGNNTGPVYVLLYNNTNSCSGCGSNGGTLVKLSAGSGAYTIRGLQNGSYTVSAFMDTLGTGQPNDPADPSGNSATINISSLNITTGADITLTDPTVTIPAAPSIGVVDPGNSSAFVLYSPPTDNNGNETATSYTLSWGTDTNASNGGTKTFNALGTNATVAVVPGLANGSGVYFKLLASTSAGSSAYSAITGPVTIGAPTGNNTVSGTVTFSGTATGPMIVVLHSPHGNGGIYYTVVGSQASPPTSGASYSVTGVASGDYQVAVIIDNNNTGVVSAGDFTYGFNGGAPTFAVNGATPESVTMSSASATPVVLTNYFIGGSGSGYGINLGVLGGTKQVANVTLMSGSNVAVPFDMGLDPDSSSMGVNLANGSIAPVIGQSYGFLVTFTDGSTQIITGSVGAVMGPDNVAQNLNVSSASGADTPTFSWSAPATPPTFTPFMYSVQNLGINSINVLSSVTSVDLATYGKNLTSGTYYWQVQVEDAYGNSAQVQVSTPYAAP